MSAPGQGPPDGPEQSPLLLSTATSAPRGQKRLNTKLALTVGGSLIALLVIAPLGYALWKAERGTHLSAATTEDEGKPASAAAVLAGAPSDVRPAAFPDHPPETRPASAAAAAPAAPPSDHASAPGDTDPMAQARQKAWEEYYAELDQRQKAQFSDDMAARTAETALTPSQAPATAQGPETAPAGGVTAQAVAVNGAGYAGAVSANAGYGGSGLGPAPTVVSPSAQQRAFLNGGGDLSGVSDHLQAALQSPEPFTVMQGTPIAAVMEQGINSDTPGMIRGRVSENVYDSATGRVLLIPQGSTLIGAYDSSISLGQTRVVVVWHRIIFPDTSSIDLGAMQGADQGGFAGFHDQVDTHFWSRIGHALLISIGGAAAQLSQGTGQSTYGGYNAQQIAAAALGQQFAELGQEYARAGLSIPNTLEIRPGYRFIVMVAKDVTLPPYVDRRTVGGVPVSLGQMPQ